MNVGLMQFTSIKSPTSWRKKSQEGKGIERGGEKEEGREGGGRQQLVTKPHSLPYNVVVRKSVKSQSVGQS